MSAGEVDADVHRRVGDVLIRYATGVDRRDWDLLGTCFAHDCDVDYGPIGRWTTAAAIAEFMRAAHAACGYSLHRITNIAVTASPTGVAARSYVDAVVLMEGNASGVRALGFYDDELVDGPDGFRISRRRYTSVLMQPIADTAGPG